MDMWCGQVMNNRKKLYPEYGQDIKLGIIPPKFPEDASKEQIMEMMDELLDTYPKNVYVGMDFTRCDDNCTLKPYYIFDVYTRTASKATTYSNANVTAKCNVVEKKIPIYGKNIVFAGYVTNKVVTEKKTYYYHTKTRTITQKASTKTTTDEKWSYSANDTTLINQGYKYTGTKEKVQG